MRVEMSEETVADYAEAEPLFQRSLAIAVVLLRFSGELIAHSRPAISKWTGLR